MSKFFIRRPIVAIVISILTVIGGVVALLRLPTAQFPEIADPQIQVVANYTGADANTIAQSVATPIEQQMAGVDGMNYMSSQNASNGQMALTVDFAIDTVTNTDQILSQMRVLQANSQLPSAVLNNGVTVQKSTASPLMLIDLSASNGVFDNVFLANYAFINLNDELTRVPGVASVSIFGAGEYAMRCWVNPDKLANLGITVPEIINALRTQNTVNPAGQIGGEPVPPGQQFTYTVRAPGRLPSTEEFGRDHRAGAERRRHSAPEGCGAHRVRSAELQRDWPLQRQAGSTHCRVPGAGKQCGGHGGGGAQGDGGSQDPVPPGIGLCSCAGHNTGRDLGNQGD